MNDEIKEMLDLINELVKISPNKGSYGISHKKWKQLLDYITNLQQKEKLSRQEISDVRKAFNGLQQENDKLNRQIIIMEKYFELIYNIGFDYDGYSDKEHLKKLIDELVRFASLGRACNDTEGIYIDNDNIYYNILNERIERGEKSEKDED